MDKKMVEEEGVVTGIMADGWAEVGTEKKEGCSD